MSSIQISSSSLQWFVFSSREKAELCQLIVSLGLCNTDAWEGRPASSIQGSGIIPCEELTAGERHRYRVSFQTWWKENTWMEKKMERIQQKEAEIITPIRSSRKTDCDFSCPEPAMISHQSCQRESHLPQSGTGNKAITFEEEHALGVRWEAANGETVQGCVLCKDDAELCVC